MADEDFALRYPPFTHYERSPILEERLRHAQGCRGFAPAPPGFFAWCLSRCWTCCERMDEKGMRKHPPIDRSRPLSRRSGCFPALPYPPLSPDSFYLGGIYRGASMRWVLKG